VSQWLDLFPAADDIHLNNKGAYLTAVVHFATIYGMNPTGADYTAIWNVDPDVSLEFAQYAWQVAWEVMTAYPRSGVQQTNASPPSAFVRARSAVPASRSVGIDGREVLRPARAASRVVIVETAAGARVQVWTTAR
jgi:hypothetical protein